MNQNPKPPDDFLEAMRCAEKAATECGSNIIAAAQRLHTACVLVQYNLKTAETVADQLERAGDFLILSKKALNIAVLKADAAVDMLSRIKVT